ncbi:ABC transporter permease [Clostridium oryzae]|uniref:FtsX-like permease family protein n=1 Tax=Clostridium oryzae TaxID=1450648 RepID=A0A1V4IQ60_9CLOT|nr:ABC transporter permease [Clostridium oryzae]OPJ61925.1 FtsX-like permease family protein [Clostridium oryzae]
MGKTFYKNIFRDIKKTISRFMSIVIIIALGVSFYAGVRAASPDMKLSGDYYFNKNNLMDFQVMSSLGITKKDISAVKNIDGIANVEGAYSIDAVVEKDKKPFVLNVNSLPQKNVINDLKIVSGRRAFNKNEAVVEERFLKQNGFKLGDSITFTSGDDSNLKDSLKNIKFKIVGTADSPLYVSAQRQLSSVGNGTVSGFVYILPEVFKSKVYSQMYIKTTYKEAKNSLFINEDYKKALKAIEKKIKTLGIRQSEIRYSDIVEDANEKIERTEKKLNSAQKKASKKFNEASKKIRDAKQDIIDNKDKLNSEEIAFNNKIAAGYKKINDGKNKIKQAQKEITAKSKQITDGENKIAEAKKELDKGQNDLILGKKQAVDSIRKAILKSINQAKATNNVQQYTFLKTVYDNDIKEKNFDSMYSSMESDGSLLIINKSFDIKSIKDKFNKANAKLIAGRKELASKEKLINSGKEKLDAGRKQIENSKKEITKAEVELKKGEQEGKERIQQAKEQLSNGQKEIQKNAIKLKKKEKKVNSKFADAKEKIRKSKDKIKDIKSGKWYVLGRSQNLGYENYRQDSSRIDNIGKVFPMIFFLVAALVSLTTMTRMVQESRIEIGTFKALGYSRLAIAAHYFIYSISASAIGSIIGVMLGFRIFTSLVMNAYSSLYTIPYRIMPFNVSLAIQAAAIAIVFTSAASVLAALDELREVPASLMRTKAPKAGKIILLEKITFIWSRLKFTQKVTARNILRYKQRFFMTVIGISACTGLMLTGFGLKSGITGSIERQFNKIYRYNMQTTLTEDVSRSRMEKVKDRIMADSNIKSVLFTHSENATIKNKNSGTEDIYVLVPEGKNDINKYIELNNNNKQIKLKDNGVIITKKLSKLTGKKQGDMIEIKLDDKTIGAKINDVTEHYIQHYVYMSPRYYEKLTGKTLEFNGFYGLLKNLSDNSQNKTSKIVSKIDEVNSTNFKNNSHFDFKKNMKSMDKVVLVLIISAGLLAFVVIYNLTNININERKRELATIKLLGFYNNELAGYVYRENIILTVLGAFVGLLLGIVMDNFVLSTAETNVMLMSRYIKPIYFLYAFILTLCFSLIVNAAMYGKFDRIDMIESLKSAE